MRGFHILFNLKLLANRRGLLDCVNLNFFYLSDSCQNNIDMSFSLRKKVVESWMREFLETTSFGSKQQLALGLLVDIK